MSVEDIWYESSPYVYLLAGIVVLASADGTLAIASALLLLVASGTILRLRWTHRRQRALSRARANRMRNARAAQQPKPVAAGAQPERRAGGVRG